MRLPSFLFIAGERTWQVRAPGEAAPALADVAIPADAGPAQVAEEVAAAARRLGYAGQPAVLALPSAWCLAAPMPTVGLPRNDRQAMLFRLEEQLPLSAETVVADFISGPEAALGVCARVEQLLPLVDALEAKNLAIQSIVPVAILAAQSQSGGVQGGEDARPELLLFQEGDQLNLMAIQHGRLVAWAVVPSLGADVALQVDVLSLECGSIPHVRACGVAPEVIAGVAVKVGAGNVAILRQDLVMAASRAAAAVSSGKQRPWIDLRRGPLAIRDRIRLYRRPLNAALGAAAVFLLLVAAAFFLRAHAYGQKTASHGAKMAEEFHKRFPDWQTPSNVRAVLDSEARKVLTQAPAGAAGIAGGSSLQTLQAALGYLPDGVRLRVERMAFTDTSFEIEGRLRAYADVDTLALSARQAGLEVSPPQMRRDNEGFWTFVLHGSRPEGPRAATPAPLTASQKPVDARATGQGMQP